MHWLDDNEDAGGYTSHPQVTVGATALMWPVYAVLAISGAGLVAAVFNSLLLSTIAYAVLLVAGCGLLFYRRTEAINTTRRAGGIGTISLQRVEKAAIAALSLACLANGIVIALEIASWEVWTNIRESIS